MKEKPKKIIAVFGSSQVAENDIVYHQARECGKMLAQNGYGVITGGYTGVMEAASRGAKEKNGYVIGVPTKAFKRDHTNPYIDALIWTDHYDDRISTLVSKADAYLLFKGGIGTLSELFYSWCIAQIKNPHCKPIILVGKEWKEDIKFLAKHFIIPEHDLELLHYADSVHDAVLLIKKLLPL